MRYNESEMREEGFTLIEVLIYSAILAVFLGASFSFIGSILGTTDTLLERNEIVASQEFVERKFDWLMIQTNGITIPAPSSTADQLELSVNDPSLDPAIFTLDDGSLMLSLAGGASTSITNNRVNVTNFQAEHISHDQLPPQLKISLSFQSAIYSNIISTTTLFYALPQ